MEHADSHIAVLTGDLVASESLSRSQIALAFLALDASARTQEAWHGAPLHFTRQRGDGWQVILARPDMALRSALAFRAALRGGASSCDGYMAVVEGEGPDPKTIEADLNAQTGQVFTQSGRTLDAMKAARVDVRLRHEGHSGATTAAFALADHISRGWTAAQAAAILPRLDPNCPSATTIAAAIGKSRQAVAKALHAAGIEAITIALHAIEDESRTA